MNSAAQTNLMVAGNGNQVEFQAAFAPTGHIALMANGGLFIPKEEDNGDGGSGQFVEGGVGYYVPFAKVLVFETYGLFGYGGMENHFPTSVSANPETNGEISAHLFRYGIQPNFGVVTPFFSAAASTRFVMLNYGNIEGNLVHSGTNHQAYLRDNNSHFLVEPALTVRAGLPMLKLQLQYVRSMNVSNPDFLQDKEAITIGLFFSFL